MAVACSLPAEVRAQTTSAPTPSATPVTTSLKDKTDAELVKLITGTEIPASPKEQVDGDRRVNDSPLDRLWEMDPRDAAVAFVTHYLRLQGGFPAFEIDDRNAKPPSRGEVGVRWISGNEYAAPTQGVNLLKHDGYQSTLLISEVKIVGRPSNEEIEDAVMKTDSHPLPRLVAQQAYEILWWLRHVRKTGNQIGDLVATSTSADDYGRFWMKPDGPVVGKGEFSEPCAECAAADIKQQYPRFAAALIHRLIERSGIQRRYPVPTVGTHLDPDEDAKYLDNPPPERGDASGMKLWINRLAKILQNPERQYLHDQVMDRLVPISDPLRYGDDQINVALLAVFHRGLEAAPELKRLAEIAEKAEADFDASKFPGEESLEREFKRRDEERKPRRLEERRLRDQQFNGWQAAGKLGFHDAVAAFPELLRLAKEPDGELRDYNRALIGAASIAGRHPELRPPVAEFLSEQLSNEKGTTRGTPLLEAVWRGDLRQLAPMLQQLATFPRSAPNPNDVRASAIEKASLILTAWRETDALTKTKVDALLNSVIGGGNSIPEVLRAEFAALSPEDKFAFRQFINWMRTAGATVQLHYLENTFTPHTPRPDIEFEH